MGQEYCGLHPDQYNLPDGLDAPPQRHVDHGPGKQQAASQLPADGSDIVNTVRNVQHKITKICQQTLIWSWSNPGTDKNRCKRKERTIQYQRSNLSLSSRYKNSWDVDRRTYWKNSSDGILASRLESVRFLQTSTVTSLWNTQPPSLGSGVSEVGQQCLENWIKVLLNSILRKVTMNVQIRVDEWTWSLKFYFFECVYFTFEKVEKVSELIVAAVEVLIGVNLISWSMIQKTLLSNGLHMIETEKVTLLLSRW